MFKDINIKRIKEILIERSLFLTAIFSAVIVFFIILYIFNEGYPIFEKTGLWDFLFGKTWDPTGDPSSYGIYTLVVGSFLITFGAMAIAIPLGLGSAIFISEIAPSKVKDVLKTGVELLAGIPSVVYGFFGLIVLTNWLRTTFDKPSGESWLAGSIILAIMALPTIISISEDAIGSVPREYKEASFALGATRWQTISKVIVPAATSGIAAAIILGIGKVIGETMAVMMVAGNAALVPEPITNVFSPVRTMTATLGIETGEVAMDSTHYHALFGIALILFLIALIINTIAIIISQRLKSQYTAVKKKRKATSKISMERLRSKISMERLRYGVYGAGAIALLWLLIVYFGIGFGFLIFLALLSTYIISKKISAKKFQYVAFSMITLSAIAVLITLGIILYYIIANGIPALSWEFISQPPSDLGRAGGIFPAIVGTLYLVGGAILIALPIGVGAGIYLAEYMKEGKLTKIIRVGIHNLNGTPSIVFGLFGFSFLVLYLNMGVCMLAGQIIMALTILPMIIITTEESVKAVPQSLREASLALGATKWRTIRKVVLPSAIPGILTGAILSIGIAAGETAPIMFTAVTFTQKYLPSSPFDPVMALPYHLYVLATEIPGGEINAAGTALVLLIIVLLLYLIAIIIRNHYKKVLKW